MAKEEKEERERSGPPSNGGTNSIQVYPQRSGSSGIHLHQGREGPVYPKVLFSSLQYQAAKTTMAKRPPLCSTSFKGREAYSP